MTKVFKWVITFNLSFIDFMPHQRYVHRTQLCLQDTSRSSKWHRRAAVGHWVSLCVKCCSVVVVDSVPRWRLSLSWPIHSDHLAIADQMIPPSGREHSHGKTQYIPGKQVLVRSRLWKIYLFITSIFCILSETEVVSSETFFCLSEVFSILNGPFKYIYVNHWVGSSATMLKCWTEYEKGWALDAVA